MPSSRLGRKCYPVSHFLRVVLIIDYLGHYLQVCPTNLDPTYDKPPDNKYVCTCCQARGQHYRSLCPRNTDPYSIFQRRKAQGIVTPGIDSSEYDSQKEFDRMRGGKRERGRNSEYSNVSTPDKKARLQELEEQAKRLVSEEIADVEEVGLLPLGTRHACKSTEGWLTCVF
jgi:hypothetical protein